ncbi:ParB/RepB/Spo0J family partition protein [Corynebacterium lubricantis]|uniref:ParB/RepB/Spo0J family partition protein n=1 Tax=Corynebacterium lubricantis TaxID=541095 RepID=UPI0003767AC7|nr:ParB/RepB/Spo0J family partition protein [Corynebacterium lubricantis]
MAQEPTRKGGLGRGLAALIPSAPIDTGKTNGIGASAADVVFGEGKGKEKPGKPDQQEQNVTKDDSAKSDGKKIKGAPSIPGAPTMRNPSVTPKPTLPPAVSAAAAQGDAQAGGQEDSFGATYQEIPLGQITPNSQQPRQVFGEEELAELVHSIREFGLLQPIVVRPISDGYELIMGERRWRAAAKAGLKTIPAIVRETSDGDMLRDALLENIHRVQLNPLEEAAAYQQLLQEFDVTQEELATRLGRSRPVITNMIRLLNLPVSVQRRVAAGVLSSGHARALLGVKLGDEATERLADRVVAEGLSVRATEEAVTLLNKNGEVPEKPKPAAVEQPEFLSVAAERLADEWETKVSVSMGKRKGKIVVEFSDKDDFERILGLIEGNN